jgi:hypothetical protein
MPPELSLRQFQHVARQSEGGTVRLAEDSKSELVNKGTIGHKIASLFKGLGRLLGMTDTRQERQTGALNGFANALKDHYGTEAGNFGLERTGLKTPGQKGELKADIAMNGEDIQLAMQEAERKLREISKENDKLMERLSPGGNLYAGLADDEQLKELGFDPDAGLPEDAEFESRLRERFRVASDGGRNFISPGDAKEIAKEELKTILSLSHVELAEIKDARGVYLQAMDRLAVDSFGSTVEEVDKLLSDASKALDDRLKAEGRHMTSEQREATMEQELLRVMRNRMAQGTDIEPTNEQRLWNETMGRNSPKNTTEADRLQDFQSDALSKKSPLRRACDNARKITSSRAPEGEKTEARRKISASKALMGALARAVGSRGQLRSSDVAIVTGVRHARSERLAEDMKTGRGETLGTAMARFRNTTPEDRKAGQIEFYEARLREAKETMNTDLKLKSPEQRLKDAESVAYFTQQLDDARRS